MKTYIVYFNGVKVGLESRQSKVVADERRASNPKPAKNKMKASTKEQILVALCREAGTDGVGMTKPEVWAKLRNVSARTKKAAALEIGEMFGFSEAQINTVQCGL